jgi:AraC family transcriptional regulator
MIHHSYEVTSYIYTGPQPGFMKPEETYNHYFILAVETGSYEYVVGNQSGRASFGDLVFTPPGTAFKRKALGDITFHLLAFTALGGRDSTLDKLPVGKVTLSDVNRLSSTYSYLRNIYHEPITSHAKEGIVSHLLMDLLYMCELEEKHAQNRKRVMDPLMQQAAGHIQRYLYDEISMQGIASKLGIKPSELTRRFRLAYGCAPIEYATNLRLEEVKRQLIETTDTLEVIATRCGYESGSYLSRVFSSKTGIPPSVFRRRYQF